MSIPEKYNYAPQEDFEIKRFRKPALKTVQRKKVQKKVNYGKIFLLVLFMCFILFPAMKNAYNYTILNKIKNSKIKVDIDNHVNPAQSVVANTELFGRNFVGKVSFKKPMMAQLKLNSEMPRLQNELIYLIKQYPNLKAGVFIWDYQTGNYVSINGDSQFATASIIKVPILIQMFKRIEAKELGLYEKFPMTSYYRTAGSGYLQYKPDGMKFEMNDLANYMIRTSDNTATNMILSAVGGVNEMNMALRNWGFSKTYMKTWLPDLYGTNVSTPYDMAAMLYNADNPDFLSLENRAKIVEIMSRVKNRSLLQDGIPDGARLIHKTGDIGEMLGDVGVVTMPSGRRYIITVMVKRRWNDYSARTLINSISSTTYNAFASNNL